MDQKFMKFHLKKILLQTFTNLGSTDIEKVLGHLMNYMIQMKIKKKIQ